MNLIQKIIKGDNCRKTRFHDEKGNIPTIKQIFFNGSRAYFTGIIKLILNIRPITPWISYDAVKVIKNHLNKNARVLEFGSGMSTLWFAKNFGFVVSVENYQPWYDKINKEIKISKLSNIKYVFFKDKLKYANPKNVTDSLFDLILIDGDYRSDCIRNSLDLLADKGIIYLDNSDKDVSENGGDMRIAEEILLVYAKEKKGKIIYFTDFAPTQFTPNQGLMVLLED